MLFPKKKIGGEQGIRTLDTGFSQYTRLAGERLRPTRPTLHVSIRASSAGGGGGIRTHGTLAGPTVFKTVTLNRSDTPPGTVLELPTKIIAYQDLIVNGYFSFPSPFAAC